MNSIFDSYEPFKGEVISRTRGTIVAFEKEQQQHMDYLMHKKEGIYL